MAVYKGNKRAVIYHGDKHPAELHEGNRKFAGYKRQQQSGSQLQFEHTYNASFDSLKFEGSSAQKNTPESVKSAQGVSRFEYSPIKDEQGITRCNIDALVVNGRMEQQTYDGKNLASVNYIDNVGWAEKNAELLNNFSALKAGTYTLSATSRITDWEAPPEGKSNRSQILIYSQKNAAYSRLTFKSVVTQSDVGKEFKAFVTFNVPVDNDITRVNLYGCGNDTTGASGRADFFDIQIERGATATDFEPYVGEQRAPSPKYPQAIRAVVNPELTVSGANLFNVPDHSAPRGYALAQYGNPRNEAYLQSLIGEDVTISFDFEMDYQPTDSVLVYQYQTEGYGISQSTVEYQPSQVKPNVPIHFVAKGKWQKLNDPTLHGNYGTWIVYARSADDRIAEHNCTIKNFQIILGSTEKPFEHYVSPATISLPFTLYGDGDVNDTVEPDVIVKGEHKCRVIRRWKKDTVTLAGQNAGSNTYTETIPDMYLTSEAGWHNNLVYCSTAIRGYITSCEQSVAVLANQNRIYFTGRDEEARARFSEHEVVYRLAEPAIELYDPIPIDILYPTTVISCKSDDLLPLMDVSMRTPASPSPDYQQPILSTEGVDVTVRGKNILNAFGRTQVTPTGQRLGPRNLSEDVYFVAFTANDYLDMTQLESNWYIDNNKQEIALQAKGPGYGIAFPIKLRPEWNRIVIRSSLDSANAVIGIGVYDIDKRWIRMENSVLDSSKVDTVYTRQPGDEWITVVLRPTPLYGVGVYKNVQVEVSNVSTPYEISHPIVEASFPDRLMGFSTVDTLEYNVPSGCDYAYWLDPDSLNITHGRVIPPNPSSTSGWGGTDTLGFYFYAGSQGRKLPQPSTQTTFFTSWGFPNGGHNVQNGWGAVNVNSGSYAGWYFAFRVYRHWLTALGWDGVSTNILPYVAEYLRRHPLWFFYRTVDYTPEKDIRVNKRTIYNKRIAITGEETFIGIRKYYDRPGQVDRYFAPPNQVSGTGAEKSTHFIYKFANWDSDGNADTFCTNANQIHFCLPWKRLKGVEYMADDSNFDAITTAFKAYFAEQLAAGTPVEVEYQLATPVVAYSPVDAALNTVWPTTVVESSIDRTAAIAKVTDFEVLNVVQA